MFPNFHQFGHVASRQECVRSKERSQLARFIVCDFWLESGWEADSLITKAAFNLRVEIVEAGTENKLGRNDGEEVRFTAFFRTNLDSQNEAPDSKRRHF